MRKGHCKERAIGQHQGLMALLSYRFIKVVLDTRLGSELITEVVISLNERRILEEWQLSKVVFIPKPTKDHRAAKGWHPVNCIRKLVEKVIANKLQMAVLFHKG